MHNNIARKIGTSLMVVLILIVGGWELSAAEFYLRADTATVTMPDGTVVTMWGFAKDSSAGAGDGTVSVPGPALTVPPGDSSLVIHCQNKLPEPVSLVIPGQVTAMAPVRNADGRVRSFTAETASGGSGTYAWNDFKPGTYMYHSGSHPAVQVQMGLYGAVTKDSGVGEAYPGVPYRRQVTLFYSEIDPALHAAVATAGGYGPGAAMTSTIAYNAKYFLVNGMPFSTTQTKSIFAGRPGERVLVRFLNAGLATHIPLLEGMYMAIIAEDGNKYAYPRGQYTVDLSSLKTVDAIVIPTEKGSYPVYDRRLDLTNNVFSPGGMLAYLKIAPPLALYLSSDVVKGGDGLALDIELGENITRPFDLYFVLDSPVGIFTIALNGNITPGIKVLLKKVPAANAPIWLTVWQRITVPPGIIPGIYTFYLVAVDAGKVPPISTLSDLTSTTPNVIYLDKQPLEIQ